ncbi:MAG TPA: hypothetical protein VFX06_15030 [Stellaceae bacterium]|jgi:hypothetical protein|nr:hypothetical protein [Stellaceae bacterium]
MRSGVLPALAAILWIAGSAGALAQPAANESAQQNVRESQQYERLVCANPGFRANRIAKECGPLQGSPLYDSCVASFQCNGPVPRQMRRAPASERIR